MKPLGLILAGGLARRLGGLDKAALRLGGEPLIARAGTLLAPQCTGLAINANGDPARFAPYALPVLADDPQDFSGPLAGVLAGLEYARRERPDIDSLVSLAVDTPFAPADLVERLSLAGRVGGATIAVAASGGRRHHVVALWPVALADELRAAIGAGERRVEAFQARYSVAVAEWPAQPFDPYFNINTAQDLAEAEARLAASGG